MLDGFKQLGKYIKQTNKNANLSLKRPVPPQLSTERIREVFDSENPVRAEFKVPNQMKKVLLDLNFGQRLPSIACCGDCVCGSTESFTTDGLFSGIVNLHDPYIPLSTRVYLDGAPATLGVDYIESSPATGQLQVLDNTTEHIIVSYIYTVGNCTESLCIDKRFECIDYQFLSGLTTVFSDRYDRSSAIDSSGGCGYYFNTTTFAKTEAFVADGEAIFGNNEAAWLGGVDVTVGKSVEVLAAVNLDSTNIGGTITFALRGEVLDSISSTNQGITTFDFTKLTATTMRIRITFNAMVFEFSDAPFTVIETDILRDSGGQVETTITIEGGRYWFSMAQMEGFVQAKAWPQFTTPPSGAQVTGQLVDTYTVDPVHTDEIDRQWAVPAVSSLRIQGGGIEAIQVGAGLDNGWWGILGGNEGATGYYCGEVPDGLIRFGYNCGVNGSSTVTYGGTAPRAQWGISYPHFVPPDGGDGRLIDYTQNVIAISTGNAGFGHPRAIRIKGQIVGSIWNSSVTAEIKKYPSTPLTMGGANGIQGGITLGTFQVAPDGTPQDFDLFVPINPGETYVRIGIHVPNLTEIAKQQPYYFAFPTLPNNAGSTIEFYFFRAEAVQSVNCTTGPFCNDCENTRCPQIIDDFTSDTSTRTNPADFYRTPRSGLPVFYDANSKIQTFEFTGTTQKITAGNASAFVNIEYQSPFDCYYPEEENSWEAVFDLRLTPPSSGTGEFGFGNLEINVSSAGAISLFSFSTSPTWASVGTNITANNWYSIRYRIETVGSVVNLKLRTWLAGTTEPDTWNFEATTVMGQFVMWSGSATNFISEVRNVDINKLGMVV